MAGNVCTVSTSDGNWPVFYALFIGAVGHLGTVKAVPFFVWSGPCRSKIEYERKRSPMNWKKCLALLLAAVLTLALAACGPATNEATTPSESNAPSEGSTPGESTGDETAPAAGSKHVENLVVGITGSVGKTSTKEFIAAVLAEKYKVHKTAGNYNNEVGLPLTIFGIQDDDQIAVLEMGINTFGEMHRLSEVARPDICVMTNIGQCHLENLIDRDGILRAKSEIFDFMNPEGTVIVNGDDDKLATIHDVYGKAPITFGMNKDNAIWADHIENRGLLGSRADIHMGDVLVHANIPLPGEHMIYNAMAAAAVGVQFDMTKEEITAGISHVEAVAGRSHLIETGDKVVIDDCYNANPVSMKAAIDLLATAPGRKVAILGDMFELGENERAMHREVGQYAAEKGIDLILCVGGLSSEMYEGAAEKGGEARHFEIREALEAVLQDLLQPGDTVLVKASHSMAFENIVQNIQENE